MANNNLIEWFRQATPYINRHRGKTFVIMLSGDTVADSHIHNLIHDIVLLQSLGIQLVVVHGMRRQLDEQLVKQGIDSQLVNGVRITSAEVLELAIQSSSLIRSRLERKLSMGLPNSPMHGARVKVASANVITARPAGVIDGYDLEHTGIVRKVDEQAIENLLSLGNIVLLSPIGYSPSGEAFNLSFQAMAAEIAIALNADKIIAFSKLHSLTAINEEKIAELTPASAKTLLQTHASSLDEELALCIQHCLSAVEQGVKRAHLMDYTEDGSLLMELFSVDGQGVLLQEQNFEVIREAQANDVPSIIDIIRPLEQTGVLVRRDRDKLEAEINRFFVIERENLTIAAAALYLSADGKSAEVACITTHPDYRGSQRGGALLKHLESKASSQGVEKIFVLTTQTAHWFLEQGFKPGSLDDLPAERQDLYNFQRNSKVLVKSL